MLQDRNNPNVPLLLATRLLSALIDSNSNSNTPKIATLERVLDSSERGQVLLFRASVPVLGDHPLLLAMSSETGRWCVLPVHEDLDDEEGWSGCDLTEPLIMQWAALGGTDTCTEGLAIYGFSERDPMELS